MSAVKIIVVAVTAGLALAAGPAAAGVLDAKSKVKSSETIGAAAAGDPQPFTASAAAECGKSACIVDFGKKESKIRTIQWINCGVTLNSGIIRIGAVVIGNLGNARGYFSTVSNVLDDAGQAAVFEYKNPVVVPAGEKLLVFFAVRGTAAGAGQCLLGGTLE